MKLTYLSIVLALLILGSSSCKQEKLATKKPNIIFIITDDQSKAQFNFNPEGKGKNLCPNIDLLANEGVILREHHVSSPVCTPSRFSCLTGMYASRSDCSWLTGRIKEEGMTAVDWNSYIMTETPTLPEIFQKNGYATGAVGKNHVVFLEGLDAMSPKPTTAADDPAAKEALINIQKLLKEKFYQCGFDYAEGIYPNNPYYLGPLDLAVHNQEWITEAAVNFIDLNKDNPFFLYFATTLPHGPTEKKRSWAANEKYSGIGILDEKPNSGHPERETIEKRLNEAGLGGKDKNKEGVLWVDDAIGVLLKKLEKENILDNTIIVLLSDHDMMSKGTIYQGGAHTSSFIWKKGGFPVGNELNSFTSNVDFAPTFLELANITDTTISKDGISFAAQLDGNKENAREQLFFEIGYTRGVRVGKWKYIALRYSDMAKNMSIEERQKRLDKHRSIMVSQGKDKYIDLNTDPMAPFSHMVLTPGGSGADFGAIAKYPDYFDPDQLYNLEEDPFEQNNLASDPQYKSILDDLKIRLTGELEKLPGGFPDFVPLSKEL